MYPFNESDHGKKNTQPEALNIMVSVSTIASRYSVSKQTIWNWVAENKFPKPIRLTPRCTRWRLEDIEKWEANKISA